VDRGSQTFAGLGTTIDAGCEENDIGQETRIPEIRNPSQNRMTNSETVDELLTQLSSRTTAPSKGSFSLRLRASA
jgi:hypothetical protein